MNVTPIKTKRDYARALKEVEALMVAERGTPKTSSPSSVAETASTRCWAAGVRSPSR